MNNGKDDLELKVTKIRNEIEKVIVGQETLINNIIVGLFADGHLLLEGYPGLGKTLTIKTLAQVIDAKFQRVQFTPDLIPSDITGFELYDPETKRASIQKGPVFTNILLADEINRAPAKVQSALLEAMQERQVTIGRESYSLDKLFMVVATQNPIEIAGTYLLPEAEIDRFMLKVKVTYPSYNEERIITENQVKDENANIELVFNPDEIISLRNFIREKYPLTEDMPIVRYATRIIRASRPEESDDDKINDLVHYGASPRASIDLARAARVYAFIMGDDIILPEHIQEMVFPVLRHRIILTHEAETQGIEPDDIVELIIKNEPRNE